MLFDPTIATFFIDTSAYDAARENPIRRGTFLYDLVLDWKKQRAAGARLASIKSSEGNLFDPRIVYRDPAFPLQWAAADAAGLARMAWHYFHPKQNAIVQANGYIALMREAGVKPTDRLALDFETMDSMSAIACMEAAGSWYYEVHKAFPASEIVMYVGYYFWEGLRAMGANAKWAAAMSLWLPWYPWDPTPKTKNPPPPFRAEKIESMRQDILTGDVAFKAPYPWKKISYLQYTGHADTRDVPGHPAVKVVCDLDIAFVNVQLPDAPAEETPVPEQPKTLDERVTALEGRVKALEAK